jgi:DNA (cytosine-5)-methyltransferase 1
MTDVLTMGSVCSGYGGAELAFQGLAESVFMSEIASFPRAILAARFPDVPLYGDFTQLIEDPPLCDILTGGTPCQAFSISGKRRSLEDARGNLTLAFVMLLNALDDKREALGSPPAACLWENVTGVLNVKDNAFGCFLAALVGRTEPFVSGRRKGHWPKAGIVIGPRRRAAWRVCDAQFWGVPQRRRRVFVVASAREGFHPGQVLFERPGVSGNTSSRAKKAQNSSIGPLGCTSPGGGWRIGGDEAAAGHLVAYRTNTADSNNDVVVAYGGNNTAGPIKVATALNACASASGRMDFESETFCVTGRITHTLTVSGSDASEDGTGRGHPVTFERGRVRRFTPKECERLQGLPDDWTKIAYRNRTADKCPDGPRYKAIGNGWAIPCVRPLAASLVVEMLFTC